MRRGDGDVERNPADPEHPDAVLGRDRVDALAPRELLGYLTHHVGRGGMPDVFDAGDGLAVVVVAHRPGKGNHRTGVRACHCGGEEVLRQGRFGDQGGSVEATARALFVHPNTVRYRLKRIAEVTGYSPSAPREAYVLRLAITLGRQHSN